MLLTQLPADLEDVEALITRRKKAAERKEMWRSIYTECYRYAMPARESFTWSMPGQEKNNRLYDSTLQEATYEAANTLCALLFPPWMRWCELTVGTGIDPDEVPNEVTIGLQKATKVFFDFLDQSNFSTVVNETALDLMVGTGSMDFDEGDDEQPFVFTANPLSAIELEEGPNGTVETTFMVRKPTARNLVRMYKGMDPFDLSPSTQEALQNTPDKEIEVIQCEVYHPHERRYYGIVVEEQAKQIIWRYDYGKSCPRITARATKCAGELYGRGRVMLALSDARTLDKMVEFVLRQAAIQCAPPMTAVSDGVFNPYTAVIQPNIVIPVASNDTANPSVQVLEVGGNFQITEIRITNLQERVRRTMLGPEMSTGPIKTATEITVADRNRMWVMNGEFSRIQVELLAKIVTRGVQILQNRGLIPKFRINGREVTIRFTSPFANSQNSKDLMALDTALARMAALGPEALHLQFATEDFGRFVAEKAGLDMSLVRSKEQRDQKVAEAAQALQQVTEAQAEGMQMPAQVGMSA